MGFTGSTSEAGIHFGHFNGATGDKLLPETMGGGVAVLDFDGDGHPDLLFVNSTSWPGAPAGRVGGDWAEDQGEERERIEAGLDRETE